MIFGLMSFTAGKGKTDFEGVLAARFSARQVLGLYNDTTLEKATSDKVQANSGTATTKSANIPSGFNDLFITSTNGTKLNSRAVSFVQDYMEKNNNKLEKMKSWGRPYFNMIDGILLKHGFPKN